MGDSGDRGLSGKREVGGLGNEGNSLILKDSYMRGLLLLSNFRDLLRTLLFHAFKYLCFVNLFCLLANSLKLCSFIFR